MQENTIGAHNPGLEISNESPIYGTSQFSHEERKFILPALVATALAVGGCGGEGTPAQVSAPTPTIRFIDGGTVYVDAPTETPTVQPTPDIGARAVATADVPPAPPIESPAPIVPSEVAPEPPTAQPVRATETQPPATRRVEPTKVPATAEPAPAPTLEAPTPVKPEAPATNTILELNFDGQNYWHISGAESKPVKMEITHDVTLDGHPTLRVESPMNGKDDLTSSTEVWWDMGRSDLADQRPIDLTNSEISCKIFVPPSYVNRVYVRPYAKDTSARNNFGTQTLITQPGWMTITADMQNPDDTNTVDIGFSPQEGNTIGIRFQTYDTDFGSPDPFYIAGCKVVR